MSVKHRVGRLYKLYVGIWIQLVSHGPDPSCNDWWGGAKGEGREEEGSGDFEQDAVAQWNVIIEIIFRKRNIACDVPQV